MIHIEEDFAGRRIDGFADLVALWDFAEEHSGVVAVGVEGFEHHDEVVFFEDFSHGFEHINDIGGLVIPGEAEVVRARDDGHPFCADSFCTGGGGFGFLLEIGAGFFSTKGVDRFAPFGVGDENAHFNAEIAHFLAEFFLHFG